MADSIWVSTDGNMAAAGSYSPSGVPIVNGSVYFSDASIQSVVSGLTAFNAFDTTLIWFQPTYPGNIGANGNPLVHYTKKTIHQGTGTLYDAPGLYSQGTQQYVVVDSTNQIDAYVLTTTNGAEGVSLTLACKSGGVLVPDNANTLIGTLLIGGSGSGRFPIVTIGTIAGVRLYRQTSGYVTTKTGVGISYRAVLDNGTLIYDALGTAGWGGVVELTGGQFIYNGTGTMAECIANSGTLDMTQDSRAKTITKLTLMPGSTFLTHDNITVTKLIDLRPKYPLLEVALP